MSEAEVFVVIRLAIVILIFGGLYWRWGKQLIAWIKKKRHREPDNGG